MKIESAEVFVASPGRNYVTLKLTTDTGLTGLGDATLNGRELAVVAYLQEHVAPLLVGRDAHAIEDTWQYLYRGAYWRRGPVTMAAIAAVDMALWDIKAKAAQMPLYQLLGGPSRTKLRAYAHATGWSTGELIASVQQRIDEGFTAVRIQPGVPGLNRTYGVNGAGSALGAYEPAARLALPEEEDWDTSAYMRHIPGVFGTVRDKFGPEIDLLHDVHHRLTPIQAAKLGAALEPFNPFWLEDVTPAENQAALSLVRTHTTVPLAIGETFNSIFDYQILIRDQLIDYVRSAVTHAGGITAMRKLADYAALYQIKLAIHGPSDISPVGFAAALHLDLAVHNFGIQEYMMHPVQARDVFDVDYTYADGALYLSDSPGLGVRYDETAAAAYPYERAYLPVNRLKDGTLHDW
ncbi:D-mannonate dehydratase ManD [Pseudarthrobacter raffinosi]|uniref:D-mannonate dehydratase ManD n=1 Tax=Pseudarthrobacter raffinosi TaxID=2953651 RepID=UPI00208FBF97|nr:D-mannonate dehydratase ManD [Pseudarthrobacter sp. MDT3-9]MCO4253262.1 D-galactonate dehydratase family protein [Pseudarthrobacter sp. MDT3-9]